MSSLPTKMDILGWRLDWLAVQFGVGVEDFANEEVEEEGEVRKAVFPSCEKCRLILVENQDSNELGSRIEELSEWLEESIAEWELREMEVLLQAEGEEAEEEKTGVFSPLF